MRAILIDPFHNTFNLNFVCRAEATLVLYQPSSFYPVRKGINQLTGITNQLLSGNGQPVNRGLSRPVF